MNAIASRPKASVSVIHLLDRLGAARMAAAPEVGVCAAKETEELVEAAFLRMHFRLLSRGATCRRAR